MRFPLSIIVIGFLLAEIAGFILVGEWLGVLATLGLILLSMIAGAVLLRRQGLATLERSRADIRARRLPARPLFDGALQAAAAFLMILPGFITDLIGIALFIPGVRNAIWRRMSRGVEIRAARAGFERPSLGPVVELDSGEYRPAARPDTPWRPDGQRR